MFVLVCYIDDFEIIDSDEVVIVWFFLDSFDYILWIMVCDYGYVVCLVYVKVYVVL